MRSITKVKITKHKANSAAWIIKKAMNLHGPLQKKTSKRRDEELQEFSDSQLKQAVYRAICRSILKGACQCMSSCEGPVGVATEDLFEAILNGSMVAQAPTDRAALKAAHDQAPIRKRRIRIRSKSSFVSSESVAEASSLQAVSEQVAENESSAQASGEEPQHSDSKDATAAGVPTCEVPPSTIEAESDMVDLVSEAEPEQGDPNQVVGLNELGEVHPKSPAKAVLRRMNVVEILDSPCPPHAQGIALEEAVPQTDKSLDGSKQLLVRDPSRFLMPTGVREAAHECLVQERVRVREREREGGERGN